MNSYTFTKNILGLTMWSKFSEIFRLIDEGHNRILVRSANGVGKTTALAALCNWKLSTNPESIVLTTASTREHLRRNLWGEIRSQARRSRLYPDRAVREDSIKLGDKHFAASVSPRRPESAQGYHAPSMLIAVDEATAADKDTVNALLATATGNAQVVMCYNPLANDSFVYEAERSGAWKVVEISAFDHPNIIIGADIIPGAVTRRSLTENILNWSFETEDDRRGVFAFAGKHYRRTSEIIKRIFGQWDDTAGEGFIPLYQLHRSLKANPERGVKAIGVDVARGGEDATVFSFFDGGVQERLELVHSRDIVEIAERLRRYHDEGWKLIAVDDTGVGGGVTDHLQSYGIDVCAVNFGRPAKGFFLRKKKELRNARAEMYFLLAEELKLGKLRLVNDPLLHQEITSVRLRNRNGVYILEPKDEVRRRLGRSPDRADATVLARYAIRSAASNRPTLM